MKIACPYPAQALEFAPAPTSTFALDLPSHATVTPSTFPPYLWLCAHSEALSTTAEAISEPQPAQVRALQAISEQQLAQKKAMAMKMARQPVASFGRPFPIAGGYFSRVGTCAHAGA